MKRQARNTKHWYRKQRQGNATNSISHVSITPFFWCLEGGGGMFYTMFQSFLHPEFRVRDHLVLGGWVSGVGVDPTGGERTDPRKGPLPPQRAG